MSSASPLLPANNTLCYLELPHHWFSLNPTVLLWDMEHSRFFCTLWIWAIFLHNLSDIPKIRGLVSLASGLKSKILHAESTMFTTRSYGWVITWAFEEPGLFHHGKEKFCGKNDHRLYMCESLSCSLAINYSYSETSQGKTSHVCWLCVPLFRLNKDFLFPVMQGQGWSMADPALSSSPPHSWPVGVSLFFVFFFFNHHRSSA